MRSDARAGRNARLAPAEHDIDGLLQRAHRMQHESVDERGFGQILRRQHEAPVTGALYADRRRQDTRHRFHRAVQRKFTQTDDVAQPLCIDLLIHA